MTMLNWVILTRQLVWLPSLTDGEYANDHEAGPSHTNDTTTQEQAGGGSELDQISPSFDANFQL